LRAIFNHLKNKTTFSFAVFYSLIIPHFRFIVKSILSLIKFASNNVINIDTMALDWGLCIICQSGSPDDLRCPKKAAGATSLATYTNFLERCNKFREVNELPIDVKFSTEVSAEDLHENDAKWHHSCYLKFNNKALTLALKRKSAGSTSCDRGRSKREKLNVNLCFLCKTEGQDLHEVQTLEFGSNILQMAKDLEDGDLLKLASENQDFVALEFKYHGRCMIHLRNRHRACLASCKKEDNHEQTLQQSRALIELCSYIKHEVSEGNYLFPMPELCKLYSARLTELGIDE
jgi:hypothetical protein